MPATVAEVIPDSTFENDRGWVRDGVQKSTNLRSVSSFAWPSGPSNRFEMNCINRADQAHAMMRTPRGVGYDGALRTELVVPFDRMEDFHADLAGETETLLRFTR